MKRRICLVGAAIAAVPFAVGIGVTAAAAKSKAHPGKPAPSKAVAVLKCHMLLSTVPPPGSPSVDQPPSQGTTYGPLHCPTKSFGTGVETASFKVAATGDSVGKYWQYFNGGTIHGKFDLAPSEGTGNLSSTSFTSETWTGTVTLIGGSGAYSKVAGKKGTLTCTSGDSVHLHCTEKLKLSAL